MLTMIITLALLYFVTAEIKKWALNLKTKRAAAWCQEDLSSWPGTEEKSGIDVKKLIQMFEKAGISPKNGTWTNDDILNASRTLETINKPGKKQFLMLAKKISILLEKGWKRIPLFIASAKKLLFNLFSGITKWLWMKKWYAFATLAIALVSFMVGASLGLKQVQIPNTQNAVLKSKALILEKQVSTLKKEIQAKDTLLTKMAEMVKQSPPSTVPLKRFPAPSVKLIELSQSVQQTTEPTKTCTVERQGEALWQVLAENIGKLPTTEEMKRVVTANNLPETTDANGQWIVKIYPGQRLNISSLFPT